MKKQLTFEQVTVPISDRQNSDVLVAYRCTKAIDTMMVTVGTVLRPHEVQHYCQDRNCRVTILPSKVTK